jgi:hypothetical protein
MTSGERRYGIMASLYINRSGLDKGWVLKAVCTAVGRFRVLVKS